MAEQIPLPVGVFSLLPPLPIDGGALLKFSRELNGRLSDFEQRFAEPRQNPRIFFGQSRMAPRKPR